MHQFQQQMQVELEQESNSDQTGSILHNHEMTVEDGANAKDIVPAQAKASDGGIGISSKLKTQT